MSDTTEQLLEFPVFFEKDEHGGYVAVCPAIPGCYSQGDSIEEAEENIREAIVLCLEDVAEEQTASASTLQS